MKNKFKIQDSEYIQPYHHLVSFDKDYRQWKSLSWGLEYYSYISKIIEIVRKLKFNTVADVGCGDGKILLELAKRNSNKYFEGYDLSERAVLFAKGYSQGYKNLKFFCHDFKKSPKTYDLIICAEVLEHIPNSEIKAFSKSIYERLNDNGKIIFTVPSLNKKSISKHYRHYDLNLLKKQFKKFKIIYYEYIHKNNYLFKILSITLENNIFILKNKFLLNLIRNLYVSFCLKANKNNGHHILFIGQKKNN